MSAATAGGQHFDAIVIGGGVGGLAAAAYLARGAAHVVLLEAREGFGGQAETAAIGEGVSAPLLAHTFYALDARMLSELKLHRYGLRFAERDMPLVALRPGGRHIVLTRDPYSARGAIAAHAVADAAAYVRFRRETSALARRLRPLWMGAVPDEVDEISPAAVARRLGLSGADADCLETLARSSAAAYLDGWFESDAIKAALAFDTAADGLCPQEAGSALALIWRYAQESCGLQGAVSQVKGGPGALSAALVKAAQSAGAALRTGARVGAILVEGSNVAGVRLASGETLRATTVLSSLSRRQTLLALTPPDAIPFGAAAALANAPAQRIGSAKVLLVLDGPPPFAGLDPAALRGRLVVAERPESAAEAKGAALAGAVPDEFVLEAVVPSAADPSLAPASRHVMSVRMPYLPLAPRTGWGDGARDALARRVVAALEAYAPGLTGRVTASVVLTPDMIAARSGDGGEVSLQRLLASSTMRVRTKLAGLYLCGAPAEPVPAISGCAGRLAAARALGKPDRARRGSAS